MEECEICGFSGDECKAVHKAIEDAFNAIDPETGKTYNQLLKEKIDKDNG